MTACLQELGGFGHGGYAFDVPAPGVGFRHGVVVVARCRDGMAQRLGEIGGFGCRRIAHAGLLAC